MKPEISEEIISGWRREFEKEWHPNFLKRSESGAYTEQNVSWAFDGFINAKTSSHERILELENENSRLKSFCNEFVYGEENPKYYTTMQEKLTKRDELLKRSLLWNEAMLKIAIVSIDEEKQRAETTSQLYQLVADIKQLEQEK